MLPDFASVGGAEVWNHIRLQAYLTNVGSPFTSGNSICSCATLTATNVGSTDGSGNPLTAYDKPTTDPAPWYDPDLLPVSGEFLGLLVTSVSGVDGSPRARTVTNAVGGGGVFGPVRELPRTITVTGVLIGSSCCGADYGLHWLGEVLAGCDGDSCDGGCFEMFDCCPSTVLTKAQLDAQHKRTFRRTALVSGPSVTGRVATGGSCTGSCPGGDLIEVEFVLVAASPWPWTDPTPVLEVGFPIGGSGDCVTWCLRGLDPNRCVTWDTSGTGGCVWDFTGPNPCINIDDDPALECDASDCLHQTCQTAADRCADPLNPVPTPPQPTSPTAPFCVPLAPEQACYTIDLTTRPEWSSDVPIITVTAGATELRNVGIVFYEKPNGTLLTCDQIAEMNRCNPHSSFFITYIPAGGSVTIDGQIGRAMSECGGDCTTASTVYGSEDGGPVRSKELTCAQYCVCLTSDPTWPPGADAMVSISVSGRGY